MSLVERKQELFENIVRLRRAARQSPGSRDIAAVRVSLERELGETVSRRLAARVLGVSHTALDRWIKTGDLPVIYSAKGRVEVPVPALLDLYDAVDAGRADSPRYPLTATMLHHREAAQRLKIHRSRDRGDGGHDRVRARSLVYHHAVAARLSRPMVEEARHVLFRWREQGRIDERYADRWEQLLERPLPEVRRALVEESQEADDLRQSSPFAGVLSEPERLRILREVA
ncbi:MAG: hypothetical protein ABR992_06580 [Solirubrobacteraceae bacterium]|jgi:hypothetical protein